MSPRRRDKHRSFLAPEVIQSSHMDCGPAALKSLFAGYGVSLGYGRLREACQTGVDGTSITALEAVARQLGLACKQTMQPADALLEDPEGLPVLAVTRMGRGTHLAIIWRGLGPFFQVMDPIQGRRWVRRERLRDELYVHTSSVPAEAWRRWSLSASALRSVRARLKAIGARGADAGAGVAGAPPGPGGRGAATLDAAIRMVGALIEARAIKRGPEAAALLRAVHTREASGEPYAAIPESFWSVTPDGATALRLRGALFIRVFGYRGKVASDALPDELRAAIDEPAARPLRGLLRLLREDGRWPPAVLLLGLVTAVGGAWLELLLLRGMIELGGPLAGSTERVFMSLGLLAVWVLLLAVELPLMAGLLRLGRNLEVRLRVALQAKLPRLPDHFLRSRPISDMIDRAHSVPQLRLVPMQGAQAVRLLATLVLHIGAIVWLAPASAPWMAVLAVVAVGPPLVSSWAFNGAELHMRAHAGALGRFTFDALLGQTALRAHGAERALLREHESLLVQWKRAGLGLQRTALVVRAATSLACFTIAGVVLYDHLARHGASGVALLLLYLVLSVPLIARQLVELIVQYPASRNTALRLFEPLDAPETAEVPAGAGSGPGATAAAGVAIDMAGVELVAGGHPVLSQIDLTIAAGSHVAIVGTSGAGKSSLVGLLLGWLPPSRGSIRVDGVELTAGAMAEVRRATAGVAPAVPLRKRPSLEDLRAGAIDPPSCTLSWLLERADLVSVLRHLPDGLQTVLGEGGALLSGGQGQRLRFARGLLRDQARLVILDEAFRGLDRVTRGELLARARRGWAATTLLCVTHDIGDTLQFPRVMVVEGGRIIEDGVPSELAQRPDSRYRALLDDEHALQRELASLTEWRHLRLEAGQLLDAIPTAFARPAVAPELPAAEGAE